MGSGMASSIESPESFGRLLHRQLAPPLESGSSTSTSTKQLLRTVRSAHHCVPASWHSESPGLRALLSMFALADMVKPHGLLVLVSSEYRYSSTPSLSTS